MRVNLWQLKLIGINSMNWNELERHKSVKRQNCVEAQIWGTLQNKSAALKVLKDTVASIILKGQKFGKPS